MSSRQRRMGPGKTVVVTGGAGGLGRAITAELRSRGAEVISTDAPGVEGCERELDVTDPGAVRAMAEEVAPDGWVNNAGVLGSGAAVEQGDEEIRRVVEVNLVGVVNGTRAAAGSMLGRGGTILNIGSLAAWNPTPGLAIYAATKHAVRAYSGAVAAELAGSGVRVVCLCPDGIWTPMLEAVVSSSSAAAPFSGRRLLEPAEVARAAVRLMEGRRLVASLPGGRAVLAKASGLWPSIGVATRGMVARQGARNQARYRRELG